MLLSHDNPTSQADVGGKHTFRWMSFPGWDPTDLFCFSQGMGVTALIHCPSRPAERALICNGALAPIDPAGRLKWRRCVFSRFVQVLSTSVAFSWTRWRRGECGRRSRGATPTQPLPAQRQMSDGGIGDSRCFVRLLLGKQLGMRGCGEGRVLQPAEKRLVCAGVGTAHLNFIDFYPTSRIPLGPIQRS